MLLGFSLYSTSIFSRNSRGKLCGLKILYVNKYVRDGKESCISKNFHEDILEITLFIFMVNTDYLANTLIV